MTVFEILHIFRAQITRFSITWYRTRFRYSYENTYVAG
jgi:hypothetical protein